MTTTNDDRIAAALLAASHGLRIVILNNADGAPKFRKLPVGKDWGLKATDDEETLLRRFEKRPNANIGVLLGKYPEGSAIPGVIDVEFDDEEGRATAEQIFGKNTYTPTYKSARSTHRLFLWNDAFPPTQVEKRGGLEIRLGGGAKQTQSVLPPSVHKDGCDYRWLPGLSLGEVELAEVPEILAVQFCNVESALEAEGLSAAASSGSRHSDEYWGSIKGGVAEGSRNDALSRLVGKWAANAVRLDAEAAADIRERAVVWGQKCTPPLPPKECETVARSVIARDRRRREDEGKSEMLAATPIDGDRGDKATNATNATSVLAHECGRTDAANAMRFVDRYHAELLYVPQWKRWLTWDGRRWVDDSGVGARQRAKRYASTLWAELGKLGPSLSRAKLGLVQTFIKQSNGRRKMEDFLALASVDERVVCSIDDLNRDANLLNVANGTLNLRTGELSPHSPADRITQIAEISYEPSAECPRWLETLDVIFGGDRELIVYVQRLLGYSLSGDTGEHVLPIAYGSGHNGKSTVWNTVAELLGDYATLASEELLMGDRSNHPTEKAALYQKRFVAISEPERGAKLRESRVKELTGDRTITARRMHEDFWSFERTHTFWLSTNHLPSIDGTDEGIWRRVKLLPFVVDIRTKVKPIPDFDRWLVRNEGAGILAWLAAGYRGYVAHGLTEPRAVTEATRGYRDESDPLGDFLSEYCYTDASAVATASDLFDAYSGSHRGKWTRTAFGRAMAERFKKGQPRSGPYRDRIVYFGVGLRDLGASDASIEDLPKTRANLGMGTVGDSLLESPRDLTNPLARPGKPSPTIPIAKNEHASEVA